MRLSKTQLAVAGLLLGGAMILFVKQHASLTALRDQSAAQRQSLEQLATDNEALSSRLTRLKNSSGASARPPVGITALESLTGPPTANRLVQMLRDGPPRLTVEQLQHHLDENHRSAGSLLSAYRTSGDAALLREAMEKYPGDPAVAFEAVFKPDASPAERREWLEALKRAAPDNPLGNYLSALDYFKSGQSEQALQELNAASDRPSLTGYTVDRVRMDEEAYRAAGYSESEAKMAATWGVPIPEPAQLKELAEQMIALAGSFKQAGDENSAQATLQMAAALGLRMDSSSGVTMPIVSQLVGTSIERLALNAMDPSSDYGDGTVQQRLDELAKRRDAIQGLVKQSSPFYDQMTSGDWLTYNERTLSFGEENAIAWLLNKYGQPQPTANGQSAN